MPGSNAGDPGAHLPRITPVAGAADRKAFIELPKRLYRADPNWVAPLDMEQRHRLFGKNPFFDHARMAAWLARRGSRTTGRITAQVDRLYQETHGDSVGYFGMLEAEDDAGTITALLAAAEEWLRHQGVSSLRGPFNLSINEETGLLVDGFDKPPFVMMGHSAHYMAGHLEKSGYRNAKDLYTYIVSPDFTTPPVMAKLVAGIGGRVTVRPLNRNRARHDFETIRDIFNDAWSDNWGFVPFTRAEFAELTRLLSSLVPWDYVQIAEVDGVPAAFIVVLPNINEATRDLNGRLLPLGWAKLLWRLKAGTPATARVPLMGVRRRFQSSRLGPALAFMVIDAARKAGLKRGLREVEMGWILEDNSAMRNIIESLGGQIYKTYRVFEKELPSS